MRYKEVGGNRKSEKEHQNVPRVMLTLISLAVFLLAPVLCAEERTSSNVFGQCMLPLGMEEGKIPDDAITASSSYETKSVGPQNARIRQEKNGGAWCPKAQISSQIREYLEVDLTRNHLITWTETQGRFGNGQGQEYAEAFFLEYWRDTRWHQYKNLKGDRILRGNSNTYLVEKQRLDLPFVASRVRFVPYSQHPRTVCMRVEIYGCIWEQPVVRYTAPAGSFSGPNGCNVEDTSYDGIELEGQMIKGLGQLIDGILGEDTEISSCSTGTNWVGWTDRETVELIFEFQDLREFENCSIHVASVPERGIQVFSSVKIWTSVDGINYQSEPEKLELSSNLETGMVSVGLQSRLGKYVKLEMKLALRSGWLLISEVAFETVSGTKNLSGGDSSEGAHRNETDSRMDQPERPLSGFNDTIYDEPVDPGTGPGVNGNSTPDAFPVGSSQTYIGLVSGLLTMVALLLTCTTFLMKQRGRNKVALLQKHTALLCGSPAPSITINTKDVKLPNPVVMNGLAQSRLSLKCKPPVADRETSSRAASITASSAPGRDYELYSAYERSYDSFSTESLSRQPSTASCDPDYSDVKGKPSFGNEKLPDNTPFPPKRPNLFHSGKFNQRVHEGYYAATDILTIKKREQSPTLSLFTPLHIHDKDARLPRNIEPYDVQRISRHRLRILDKLGEGSFGLVHMCEAKGIQNPEIGSVQNRQVVIVRSLWRGVVDSLRKDFTKDMYILSRIRDANVARMLALVEEEPLGAVFEYGQLGDLPAFFEKQEETGDDTPASYAYCLNFATQIASGMKYLESLNLPHCDLAARNCIVCQNLTIKVSDHAMYCGKYDNQYYVDGSYAKVPLRWMAWEAALLNKKSCQADVWSYAVTVWEILTSCKEIPYSDFTAEQVMENLNRWYQAGQANENIHPRILSRPSCCLDDLYRMMTKCWTKQPDDRPTFEEIYLYLKRLGFD